jgi:DNA-binding MarR family transcriptional regulator
MVTTIEPGLAAHLRIAIARTARKLRQEAGGGLTQTLLSALASIERHGPLTPSELAERERVKRPTATKLLARLEGEGLVARTADPADRRSCLISVTGDGRALLRTVRTRKDAYLAERLKRLSPEDRATLDRAATLLEELMEDQ